MCVNGEDWEGEGGKLRGATLATVRQQAAALSHAVFAAQDIGQVVALVVQVAGAEHHEHVVVAAAHDVAHLVLGAERARHVGAQRVVYQPAADALDGLLAGGIDVGQDDLVQQRQGVGKLRVEVAGAGVEVGLEDGRQAAAVKHLAQRKDALANLLGVMGIVAQEDDAVGLYLEVEAPVHAAVGGHGLPYLVGRGAGNLCQGHGGDAVVDVDAHGHTQFDAVDAAQRRAEVEDDAAAADAQVFGVKLPLVAGVTVARDAAAGAFVHLQPRVGHQCAAVLDERGVVGETFQIGFLRTVDVEVVGVGRGDGRGVGAQVVERAVKLVRLDDHIRARGRKQVVRAVVLCDAAQEGAASHVALVQDVRQHGRRRGLAVRAGHAEALHAARQDAQHLGALHHLEARTAEMLQLAVVGGDGRGIDHQRVRLVAESSGDEGGVVVIMNLCPLGLEGARQGAGRAVVAAHGAALGQEIALKGAHAYAAGADEIYGVDVV